MGQDPPAFDILAWNDDSTRLPGAVARQLLGITEHNLLTVPGGLTLLGTPVDLSKAGTDTYVIGAETDHLVPWRAAYRTTQLLGGEATFVLSGGGHIQHLVNPPGNPKAWYRTRPAPATEPARIAAAGPPLPPGHAAGAADGAAGPARPPAGRRAGHLAGGRAGASVPGPAP